MRAEEFKKHLVQDIIPFWNKLRDEEFGGFYGSVAGDGTPIKDYMKGVILNNRILWFYSTAYRVLRDPELLSMADHAYRFMEEHCYDKNYGGVYWAVKYNGEVEDDLKHTYNQAFAIYALSAYYDVSENKDALELAYSLYDTIESKCRDAGGYLEAYNRDFTPTINYELSENGVIAERTMNTLLHVLEAYSELYRVDHCDTVGDSLKEILSLFKDKVYNPDKQICEVFFDHEYRPLIDLESYGHDIEASWLIDRACELLEDDAVTEKMRPVIEGLAASVYRNAIDEECRAVNNERENDAVDRQKIWWVQAESVVGFYNAYLKEGKEEYRAMAEDVWSFIQNRVIDKKSGEWYETIPYHGEADVTAPLSHEWKCPYHNGRMCMEMLNRLAGMQNPVNRNATKKTRELLNYLCETAGKGIITGQHTQTNPMEEVAYIKEQTGKEPKLRGFELLAYSPNINYEDASEPCLTEIYENRGTLETALKWAKESDGIVTFSFHWYSPVGGRDKSFYAEHTDFDASRILVEGTKEREAFYHDMDVIAEELKKFEEADIPILWRPFHESDGTWFWWGAKGPEVARELYKLMFEYYTNVHHINNLLWVWNCRLAEGYPGDEYVDVISVDIYLQEYAPTDYRQEYEALVEATTKNKVAALAEIGYLPDIAMLEASHTPWAYYMTWSKEFCIGEKYNSVENLKKLYASEYAVKAEK
ncbi:MAG: AGE family epimerase/isomerase [Lachnospiraceae bacterium]|nr:AGE family epimerase/isomerase [Lachnospiraceae bacterium]